MFMVSICCEIYHEASKVGIKTPLEIKPIKSSSFQTLAQRPIYSVLNCEKMEEKYGVQTSDWKRGIRQTLNKITLKMIEFNNNQRLSIY